MSHKFTAIILDDHPIDRLQLTDFLSLFPYIHTIDALPYHGSPVKKINDLRPDILFLDVNPHQTGSFSILSRLLYVPQIVFLSNSRQFATNAYDVNAVDYLLKPIILSRLAITLSRLSSSEKQSSQVSLVNDGKQSYLVHFESIIAIQAEGAYTTIFTINSTPMFIRRLISEWKSLLPDELFVQLDRSLIVNLRAINRVEYKCRDRAFLTLNGLSKPLLLKRIAIGRLKRYLRETQQYPNTLLTTKSPMKPVPLQEIPDSSQLSYANSKIIYS